MNFFLVSEIYGLIVRLPYEFLLRPWLMIQVECLPTVLNLPTDGHSGDALSIHLQQQFALYFLVAICILVLLESVVLIVQRLITFCSVKLPDFNQENMSALQPMKSSVHRAETERDGELRSPRQNRPRSPRSPRGDVREEGYGSDRGQSKQTSVSQRMTSATYGRMLGRFYWMHLEFEISRKVRTFIRRFTVIIFFLVPVYLRSLVIPWRCVPLGSNGYSVNVEYLGLFCDTNEAAILRFEARFTAVIIALPAASLLLILVTTRTRKHEPTMEALAFVTAGFKDGQRWWCVMLEGRLALVFFLMTVLEASQLRNLLLLALSTTYCLVELRVNPWNSAHNLVLSKASLMLNLSILLMTILGAWIRGMTGIQVRIRNLVVIFLTIPTVLCSVYGNAMLILNLFSEVFFGKMIALLKAGAITGPWTKCAFYVNNWLCGNLFEMHFMKSGDRYALDHSQLNTFERTQLLSMLVELIQGCLARHGKFRMKMVEVMLIMGFERAMQVRRGLLNVNFHENGHALHSLTPIGFPKVLSPDPDLAPLMELKVTLAELQDALETLMQDINAGDPEIIFRSSVFTGAVEEKKHEGRHPRQILVWDEQLQLQDIESKVLHSSGSVFAEDQAAVTEAVMTQETPAELLRRLTRILEDQLLRYQSQVDLVVKDFKDEMVKALGQKRLADAQERRSRIELAEATLNEYSDLPKPSEAGNEAKELGQEAVLSSLKIRQATSAAKEFLSKVKTWEEASDSYFTKVFEMIPKVCSGEEMKVNGNKQWEKELRDARGACLRCHEQLQRAVKACQGDALSSREATDCKVMPQN